MNNMKTLKTFFNPEKVASFVLYFSILAFIIAFNFSDNGGGRWQQQFMPFLNNRPIADMTFLDSLTGYAVTGANTGVPDTNYILKTTNSGNNWNVILSRVYSFRRVIFLNYDTGYALNLDDILRTTNAGDSWESIQTPTDRFTIRDMFPISYDTMWITFSFIGGDYIYRTTNAGFTWTQQLQGNSFDKLYFFNNRIGFVGSTDVTVLLKTSNSGLNWISVPGQRGFKEMSFIDSLTGWKTTGQLRKTSDGGIGWLNVDMPSGGKIINSSCQDFSIINNDSLWAVGGEILYSNNSIRGILYRTTNEGSSWAYQIPDTTIHLSQYYFCNFINKLNGWAYVPETSGIHTSSGGDTSFVTNIKTANNFTSDDFILYQNFPNPFNPTTRIIYELRTSSKVAVDIYDILGKEISKLVNKIQPPGKYEVEFDAAGMTSGIYFYCLLIDDLKVDTKKMILLR